MLASSLIFVLVGLGFSIFYGCNAVKIFVPKKFWSEAKKEWVNDERISEQEKCCSWLFHQFWLNFIGSFTGWVALYYLIFVRDIYKSTFRVY